MPTLNNDLDMNNFRFKDGAQNKYTAAGIPTPNYTLSELMYSQKAFMTRLPLNQFKIKTSNAAITGGVGISGCCFIPEAELMLLVDNNALNISVYNAFDIGGAEVGNITLTNFTDPESCKWMYNIYDADRRPVQAVICITEEQTNDVVIATISLTTISQTINKSALVNAVLLTPTGMWTDDATLGMESIAYDPYRNVLYCCKQDTPFDFRVIPLDGSASPAATEPFDAETLWSATMPAVNDMAFDRATRTLLIIGDQTGASNNNQDIIRVDPYTGTILETWNNFPDDLGLNVATHGQSEGIDVSPDGQYLFLSSEGNELVICERRSPNLVQRISELTTQVGNVGVGEDDLHSHSIPIGTLAKNGDRLLFSASGTFSASANNKRIRVRFGSSGTSLILDTTSLGITGAGSWLLEGEIIRTGAATQKAWAHIVSTDALLVSLPAVVTNLDQNNITGAVNLRITGEATSNNDVVIESSQVFVISVP